MEKKSTSGLIKRMSNTMGTLKKERSSIISKDRRSTSFIVEESFQHLFNINCKKFKVFLIPEIEIIPYENQSGNLPIPLHINSLYEIHSKIKMKLNTPPVFQIPKILLIYDDYDAQTMLECLIIKHFSLEQNLLKVLKRTLRKFNTLVTIKLEYCKLENTHLRTLKTILQANHSITELSINGNPNPFQNFYILLQGTKLILVSMKHCQINDRGAQLIALQLNSLEKQTILALNLSSNLISDKGGVVLAQTLRINRTLRSLSLADNLIGYETCVSFANALKGFALNQEEIKIRRRRILNFLIRRNILIDVHIQQQLQTELLSQHTLQSGSKLFSKESLTSKQKNQKRTGKDSIVTINSRKDSTSHKLSRVSAEINYQAIKQLIESQMELDNHPLVKDSVAKDGQIICQGNFKLIHLNLAYNKINVNGLLVFINILEYQKMYTSINEGIIYVILQGNLFNETSKEIMEINELLNEIHLKKRSSSLDSKRSSKRKRSAASRISLVAN